MVRKSTDSRKSGFGSARESLEANLRLSGEDRLSTSGVGSSTSNRPDEKSSGADPEIILKTSSQDLHTSYATSDSQQTEAKPSLAEFKRHYSEFLPSKPLQILGAVPKIRPLARYKDGLLAVSGACAPLTQEQVEELGKLDKIERAMDERFRRLKQSVFKWKAEKEGRDEDLFDPSSPSDQPSIPFNTPVSSGPGSSGRGGPFGKVVDFILKVGRSKEALNESSPANAPHGPQQDTPIDIDPDLDEDDEIPSYQKQVLQPFAHQYPHTTAAFAYEEGKKAGGYKEGYKAGLRQIRHEKEYQLGYDAALRAYGRSPQRRPQTEFQQRYKQPIRSPILRQDGSLVLHDDLADEVRKMMDNLNIARVNAKENPEDDKGKGKAKEERRNSSEVSEFVKNLAYELSYTQ